MRLLRVIAGGAALALAVGAAILAWEQLPAALQTPKVSAPEGSADYGQVPNFSLVERRGLLLDREGTSPQSFGLWGAFEHPADRPERADRRASPG
jgi:hypothetical protein